MECVCVDGKYMSINKYVVELRDTLNISIMRESMVGGCCDGLIIEWFHLIMSFDVP